MRLYMFPIRRCVWNKTFLCDPIVWNKVILCFIHHFSQCFYIREMPTKASNDSCLNFRFNSLKHPVHGDTPEGGLISSLTCSLAPGGVSKLGDNCEH